MPEETKYKLKGVELGTQSLSQARFSAPIYVPNETAKGVILNTWTRFSEMRTNRDLNFRWFGKTRDGTYRNLIEYINIMEKRWNSDGIPRVNLEDWQASVFKPETRNKIITILSAVAQQRPGVKFKGREKSDYLKELVIGDMYAWSEDKDNGDEMALYTMLDAIVHGTAIRYEGYEDCKKTIKELEPGEDSYDIKFKEKTIIQKKLGAKEVRLQDFYFGSMTTRKMDEQPDCVWRKIMTLNKFKEEFAGWKNAQYVLPGGDLTDETFFASFVSQEIREVASQLVEVIRYYNKEADEFVILANGVWVNPIGQKVCPLPFSHKDLPFYSIIFEPFASDFPYGKAAPDKYLGEQDAINALYNMLLDQVYVSIHKPLVTGDEDVIDDVELVPGKVNYIGADIANIQELQISAPSQAHFNMLELLHRSLQESSTDATQSGVASEAQTATAVRTASAAASRTFLLFLSFVFYGYKRKAKLRVSNILQFLTSASTLTKIMGDDGQERFDEAFQAFKVQNVSLMNGKNGTRITEIVDRETLQNKYQNREQERATLEPQNIEKNYITNDYIREFDFDAEIIPGSTISEQEEVQQALTLQFQQQILAMYPDMVNREALFDDLLKVFKKDPRLIKAQQGMGQMPPQAPQGPQQGGTPMSQQIVQRKTGGQGLGTPTLNKLTNG